MSEPWWQRQAVLIAGAVVAVVGLVALVVGGAALATSSSTRSDADAATAEVETVEGEIADLEAEGVAAGRRADDLDAAMSEYADAVFAFQVLVSLSVDAYNEVIAANDAAVDQVNAGAVEEAQAIARGRGAEAVDGYQAALEAQLSALSDLQSAVNALEEVVNDD